MLIKFVLKQADSAAGKTKVSTAHEYVFGDNLFTIGSDEINTLVLTGSAPEQAVIIREGENLTLINSAEGTSLNGKNLRREAIASLAFGDEIRIGNHVISVASAEAESENNQNGAKISTDKNSSPELLAPFKTSENGKEFSYVQNNRTEEPVEKKPARNFADILNTLRTEEDSFYFTVKNGAHEEIRIPLEQTEMPLGFDAQGKISCAVEQIAALYAIVRKDWSGIAIESQRGGAVLVNDETISTTKRLRNRDRVNFSPPRKSGKSLPSLELHEPSSLVALESILENRSSGETVNFNGVGNLTAGDVLTAKQSVPMLERIFFGYFSFFEVAAMTIGTLIAAVLVFLLLELLVV